MRWLAPALFTTLVACGARTALDPGEQRGDGGAGEGGGAGGDPTDCAPGDVRACYSGPRGTAGVGICREGQRVCEAGLFGPCLDEITPASFDECNGVDDDCNGSTDDGFCTGVQGCADGTREGFVDEAAFPDIAGCAGGFQIPGVLSELTPVCGSAGDDSDNPDGAGCSAEDLCGSGFHMCVSAGDVAASSPSGCAGVTEEPGLFFATRQSGSGCGVCALGSSTSVNCQSCVCEGDCLQTDLTANDVFGCGTVGDLTPSCEVLDRFSNDVCSTLPPPWSCGGDGCAEAHAVVKPGPGGGGVLCCRD